FLEAPAVCLPRLRQRLEPIGDLVELLVARGARHGGARRRRMTRRHSGALHGGVRVGLIARLTGDRRLKIVGSTAYRLARHRVTDLGEEVEMAMRMPGLALRLRAAHRGN